MFLLVGLGNPGPNNTNNRHNIGFKIIDEINNGSWLVVKNKTNYLFKKDIKKMWGENMKEMDEKFKIWSNAPENPQDN